MSGEQVEIETIREGDGKNFPKKGQFVKIHYTGTLETKKGQEFDSSHRRGQPFKCQIGTGQVIQAWEQGVPQLSVGQIAWFKCSPGIAYGAGGCADVIPPNSTLWFQVELLEIIPN